jgi:hypothetical protein
MSDKKIQINIKATIDAQIDITCSGGESPVEPPVEPPIEPPTGPIIIPGEEGNPPKGDFEGWLKSVPCWKGEKPVISDPFNRYATEDDRQHLGNDTCFKNEEEMVPNIPTNTRWYHCPSDEVPMLAMGPGNIWFAGLTSMGWTVKIDHHNLAGFPLVTYYTHMSELFIPNWDDDGGGQEVFAGMQLGFIGNSPAGAYDLNHSHTEMWDYSDGIENGRVNRALDPGLYTPYFGTLVLPQPEVGLLRDIGKVTGRMGYARASIVGMKVDYVSIATLRRVAAGNKFEIGGSHDRRLNELSILRLITQNVRPGDHKYTSWSLLDLGQAALDREDGKYQEKI